MHASLDSRKPHHVGGASTVSATGSDSVSAALADRTWPDRMRTGFASALRTARDLAGLVTGCPRMCGQEDVTLRQPPEGLGLGSDMSPHGLRPRRREPARRGQTPRVSTRPGRRRGRVVMPGRHRRVSMPDMGPVQLGRATAAMRRSAAEAAVASVNQTRKG